MESSKEVQVLTNAAHPTINDYHYNDIILYYTVRHISFFLFSIKLNLIKKDKQKIINNNNYYKSNQLKFDVIGGGVGS